MRTDSLVSRVGLALYGEHHTTALAAALDVDPRTVRAWASGRMEIPAGVLVDLLHLLTEQRGAVNCLIAEINAP